MDNTISRQTAIDAIYHTFCYAYCDNCEKEMNEDLCGDCHRKYQNWSASKKIIEEVINNLPSEQPEQKTGRWIFIGYNMYQCTNCGVAYTEKQLNGLRNYKYDLFLPKYCPNCGSCNGECMEIM